ncbi:MAG: EamA family transporter, partial [Pseudobdellovibrio sp.]
SASSAAALALFAFHQPSLHSFLELSREQKLLIMGIAVISTIGPLTLFLAGLQRLSSAKASIIVMIEPVVATIAASTILNENLTGLQLTGSVLIIVAMVLNSLK